MSDEAGASESTGEMPDGSTDDGAAGTVPDEGADAAVESVGTGEDGTVADEGTGALGDDETGGVAEYTTEERRISPRVRVQWAVRLVAFLVVLTLFGRVGAARVGLDPRLVPALAVVLAALGVVWVHLRYRAWRYRLRDDALYLERGVITHVRTVAPHVRIQHVDTSRGPFERALGLSTLVVYTAGSRGADVSIPGLTPEEASDLQRRLKELAIETEGGDAL